MSDGHDPDAVAEAFKGVRGELALRRLPGSWQWAEKMAARTLDLPMREGRSIGRD